MRSAVRSGVLAVALLALAAAGVAGVLEGRVVAVHDGDTLSVLVGDTPIRVRIAGIDTPEAGQPWANRARQALVARTFGKPVRVIEVEFDAYGRTVGEVYADDVCVGCELVRAGHAWVYRRYTDDPVLLRLEAEAREKGVGLWGLPESQRTPPWEWRHAGAAAHRAAPSDAPGGPDRPCGAKHACREMTSCAEARFHLETCGLTRLDGDGDGVPCEKLCGGSR